MHKRSARLASAAFAGALSASCGPVGEAPPTPSVANTSDVAKPGQSLRASHGPSESPGELASMNADERVAAYLAYESDDYEARRRITASDMLAIWADSEAEMPLREKAHAAMMEPLPRTYDPDLIARRRAKRPRNQFASEKVIPLLASPDAATKAFADVWLKAMCIGPTNEPAIDAFDARKSGPKEIEAAQEAWTKFLGP